MHITHVFSFLLGQQQVFFFFKANVTETIGNSSSAREQSRKLNLYYIKTGSNIYMTGWLHSLKRINNEGGLTGKKKRIDLRNQNTNGIGSIRYFDTEFYRLRLSY